MRRTGPRPLRTRRTAPKAASSATAVPYIASPNLGRLITSDFFAGSFSDCFAAAAKIESA